MYRFILLSILLGIFALSFHSQSVSENQVRITTPSAPWTIVIDGTDLDIHKVGLKPGGTSVYVMLVDDTTKLNVSLYIEPVGKCKATEECRDYILDLGNPAWGKFQNLAKSAVGEFSYFEFFRPEVQGHPVRMQDMYAQHVSKGYWIDLHISKVLYEKQDKSLFEDLIKSIKFVPKSERSGTDQSLDLSLQKIAEDWLAIWNADKCKESYEALTSFSQEGIPENKWVEYCQTANKALGKPRSRKLIALTLIKSLPSKPGHAGASFRFESSFEKHPLAPEFVSLTREKDGRWTVSNYLIQ